MSQEHLTGLAIISINHKIVGQISYEDLIHDFALRGFECVRLAQGVM